MQTSGLIGVMPSSTTNGGRTFGRGTPTGFPSSNSHMKEFVQRRGSGGPMTTNKSADFGNFRTVQ